MNSTRNQMRHHRLALHQSLSAVFSQAKEKEANALFNRFWGMLGSFPPNGINIDSLFSIDFREYFEKAWWIFKDANLKQANALIQKNKQRAFMLKYVGVLYWQAYLLDVAAQINDKKIKAQHVQDRYKEIILSKVEEKAETIRRMGGALKEIRDRVTLFSQNCSQEIKTIDNNARIEALKTQFTAECQISERLNRVLIEFNQDFKKFKHDLPYETDAKKMDEKRNELIRRLGAIQNQLNHAEMKLPEFEVDQLLAETKFDMESDYANLSKELDRFRSSYRRYLENLIVNISQLKFDNASFFILNQNDIDTLKVFKRLTMTKLSKETSDYIFYAMKNYHDIWEPIETLVNNQFQTVSEIKSDDFDHLDESLKTFEKQSFEKLTQIQSAFDHIVFEDSEEIKSEIDINESNELVFDAKNQQRIHAVNSQLTTSRDHFSKAKKAAKDNLMCELALIKTNAEKQKQANSLEAEKMIRALENLDPQATASSNQTRIQKQNTERTRLLSALIPVAVPTYDVASFHLPSPKPFKVTSASSGFVSAGSVVGGVIAFFALASNPIGWGVGLLCAGVMFGITARVCHVKAKNRQNKINLLKNRSPALQRDFNERNDRLKCLSSPPATEEMRHLMMEYGIRVDATQPSQIEDPAVLQCAVVGVTRKLPLFLDTKNRNLFFRHSRKEGGFDHVPVTDDGVKFNQNIQRARLGK